MARDLYSREFFERAPDDVARDLIGSDMVVREAGRTVRARIVEVEAYGGGDDPASHAFRGPTPRSAIMFGPAAFLYVYRSYGIHWCMNVVTEREGAASAVLLRAAEIHPFAETREMATSSLLRGPGNLTRGLGITGADNGADCCSGPDARISFRVGAGGRADDRVAQSERIGISRAQERLSRYFLAGHPAVSAPRARAVKKPSTAVS